MMFETILNQPAVAAKNFDLRPVRKSDMGLIEFYARDQRVANMTTTIPHPLPPGASEAFVMRSMNPDRKEDVWIMDATRTGGAELIGVVTLERMDREQSEIGYWVAPAFWNEGVAREAVHALIAANPLQNRTIFASVFQDNPASAKVLTHCGFDYLGDAESFCVARDAAVPTWTYLKKFD